ncbi:hypothetical protein BC629DRAFT_493188 [Irpex lacteus]|nr:hypothetical protein BC629DRAFT_493188 [Irpex lacteus]
MNEYVFDFLICQFNLIPCPDACSMRVPERDRVSQGGLLDVSPRSHIRRHTRHVTAKPQPPPPTRAREERILELTTPSGNDLQSVKLLCSMHPPFRCRRSLVLYRHFGSHIGSRLVLL